MDQEPSKLSDSIKANTYTKITFNLGNGGSNLDKIPVETEIWRNL